MTDVLVRTDEGEERLLELEPEAAVHVAAELFIKAFADAASGVEQLHLTAIMFRALETALAHRDDPRPSRTVQ